MKGDNKGNIGDFVEAERTTSDKNPNSILFHENNLNPNFWQFSTGKGMGLVPSFKPPKSK